MPAGRCSWHHPWTRRLRQPGCGLCTGPGTGRAGGCGNRHQELARSCASCRGMATPLGEGSTGSIRGIRGMVTSPGTDARTTGSDRCRTVPHGAAARTTPVQQARSPAVHCRYSHVVHGGIEQEQNRCPIGPHAAAGDYRFCHSRDAPTIRTNKGSAADPRRGDRTTEALRSDHAPSRSRWEPRNKPHQRRRRCRSSWSLVSAVWLPSAHVLQYRPFRCLRKLTNRQGANPALCSTDKESHQVQGGTP